MSLAIVGCRAFFKVSVCQARVVRGRCFWKRPFDCLEACCTYRSGGVLFLDFLAFTTKKSQARNPQERCEILDITPVTQDFIVKLNNQCVGGNPFLGGHLRQDVPREIFHPDAGGHATNAYGSGT
jgi:hypothetical protein